MEFFERLGRQVELRWRQSNYNEERFPEIAVESLAELPPAKYVSMLDVIRWATTANHLPRQDDIDARFGDPPLTVYVGRKFRIEVLFWVAGVPAIHQHGFSGAFHVMHGSSIHSFWDFEPQEQIEARLILGKVNFGRAELLFGGDSRAILSGSRMYHATYHLDRPSVSVVVRTLSEPNKQPQYTLLPPTIAHAPLEEIATVKRQKQLLSMLVVAEKRSDFYCIARNLAATKDAYSVFEFLRDLYHSVEDEDERQELLLAARQKHSSLVDALEPALLREEVGSRILKLRKLVDDPELKFLLALLRNIPVPHTILGLIEQRIVGCDPVTTIIGWLRKLSDVGALGTQFEDSWLLLLDGLLRGRSAEEIQGAFRQRYGDGCVSGRDLSKLCTGFRASWLLTSLCLNNPFDKEFSAIPSVQLVAESIADAGQTSHVQKAGESESRAAAVSYRCLLDAQLDQFQSHEHRRRLERRTTEAWTVNPSLRVTSPGRCPDPTIHFGESVSSHEPMVWVTDPVSSIVNPFVLGPDTAQLVPTLTPGQEFSANGVPEDLLETLSAAGVIYKDTALQARRAAWRDSLRSASLQFQGGYARIGQLLHPFTLAATREHYRHFIQQGKPRYGDGQTARRWNAHNEPVARFIHYQLTPIIQEVAGVPIKPSYVYFASYHQCAELPRHVDREQCEISLSMLIDYSPKPQGESLWPLWLETKSGAVAIHQRLGDTLIYRGRELPHYRDQLPLGHRSTHLFFHYVPRDFNGVLD